jgi:AraC-like DNA-binding protein
VIAEWVGRTMALVDHYKMAAAFGKSLHAYCTTRGVDFNVIAPAMGVEPKDLQDIKASISLKKFSSLLEHLAILTNDDLFGLKFGAYYKLGDSGPFGLGLLNAPNLDSALKYYNRFMPLTADYAHFATEIGQKYTSITWNYSPLLVHCSQYADLMATLTIRQFRKSCGPNWRPSSVDLTRKKPGSDALHRIILSPVTRFGAKECSITFHNNDLLSENSTADTRILEIMAERCEEALLSIKEALPLEIKVRDEILKRLLKRDFLLPQVAWALHMSGRNLQRQLEVNSMGFELVLEETRRELTETLLAKTDLPISVIADRVGYSGVNAFSRAATNWFGSPPSVVRQRLLVR